MASLGVSNILPKNVETWRAPKPFCFFISQESATSEAEFVNGPPRQSRRGRGGILRRSLRDRLSRSLSASFDGKSYEVFVDFDDEVI